MSYLPVIKGAKLVPILIRSGFRIIRQKGSHLTMQHIFDKTRRVTIPIHNKELPIKTLKSILKQVKITVEDFIKLLGK